MKKYAVVVCYVLLAVSFVLALAEWPLFAEERECIRFLDETPGPGYAIWDVPEDETPEAKENRIRHYRAAAKEDLLCALLGICMCPIGGALCVVTAIFCIKALLPIRDKKKRLLPILFLAGTALVFAGHLCMFILQSTI